ncbi:DUF2520 domain-containing protein [Myxococcota bacterium]|nr:DUF2520 domain-containing protein [Myxococcota bacterium]
MPDGTDALPLLTAPAAPAPLARVVLVGPGRLGRSMARALELRGVQVRLVGRDQPVPPSPLTWLTVPDRAVAEVAARVPAGGVVLHASGALDVAPLRPHRPAGSLHPLMTFPGPELAMPDLEGLPAAVAGDEEAILVAASLARTLGMAPFPVPGDRRLYHAAAVVAGNFSTVLLAVAAELLAAAGVPAGQAPALLLPLARASLENAARVGPATALTGPVARGDEEVLDAHRRALAQASPASLPTYDALLERARALVAARR